MASISTAREVKSVAFERLREMLGVRPNAVGIIPHSDGGFALKVVLPRVPGGAVPRELLSVPLEFHISVQGPKLLTGEADDPEWLKRSKARRAVRTK